MFRLAPMFPLALRTLRFRKGGFAATFIAIFVGALIVMACGGLMETGVRANVPAERLAGAPIVVAGDQSYKLTSGDDSTTLTERVPVETDLVARIADVPGVAHAVPDVSFPATVLRDDKPASSGAQGHGWQSAGLAPYRLTDGSSPQDGEVVLDAGLARQSRAHVGDNVRLVVRGDVVTARVSGVAVASHSTTHAAMFFSAADTERLAGRDGTVDAIGVQADPGTDITSLAHRVKAVAGTGTVTLTGPDRGVAEFPDVKRDASNLVVLSAVFGGMAAMVALFVVASTLSLAARHRLRELALLRTIGTTPRQLRRMILGEALVVAVLAAALAVLPARIFGRWLFDQLAGHGVVPTVVTDYQGKVPLLVGLGTALLTTIGAAVVAGRRAAKTKPIEALVEAGVQRHWLGPVRLVAALLFLGGGFALGLVTLKVLHGPMAASTAGPSVICWAIGLALLGPGITRVTMAVLRWPARAVTGLGGQLAVQNLRARAIPMAAAVAPLMLATGIATSNLYMQTTQVHEADKAYTEDVRADAVLTSSTGGVSTALLDRVQQARGVAAAGAYVASTGVVDSPHGAQNEDGWPLQGVTGATAAKTMAVPVTKGTLADLTGDTVALPVRLANKMHRGIGDTITMRLGDRDAVHLRVVAIYPAKEGYETFLLPVDLLAAHTTNGLPTQILVRAAAGVDRSALVGTLSIGGRGLARRPGRTAQRADQGARQGPADPGVGQLSDGRDDRCLHGHRGRQHADRLDRSAAARIRPAAADRCDPGTGAADDGDGGGARRDRRNRPGHSGFGAHAGAVLRVAPGFGAAVRPAVDLPGRDGVGSRADPHQHRVAGLVRAAIATRGGGTDRRIGPTAGRDRRPEAHTERRFDSSPAHPGGAAEWPRNGSTACSTRRSRPGTAARPVTGSAPTPPATRPRTPSSTRRSATRPGTPTPAGTTTDRRSTPEV